MSHGGQVWQGGDPGAWLDFSANIRPDGPPDWVRDALIGAMSEVSYYPDARMTRERATLSAFLGLPVDCVLPTAGGIEAIHLAARAARGGAVVQQPTFTEYVPALRRAGVASGTGAARVICNPNNPTGAAVSLPDGEGLLIVDEAFIHCCPERTVAPLVADRENLIVVGSLTKSLGIPGVRLGYLCAHPSVLPDLAQYQPPWALSCFAAAVLRELPHHIGGLLKDAAINRQRRNQLAAGLMQLGARIYPSEACFLLARFAPPVAPVAAALKQRGILVRECMDFPGLDDGHHLRLAVKTGDQNAKLLSALGEVL